MQRLTQACTPPQETLSRHRPVLNIFDKSPTLPKAGFIAPSASVIGDVTLGEHSSIWYGAVLRGDLNSIKIGAFTNIQARLAPRPAPERRLRELPRGCRETCLGPAERALSADCRTGLSSTWPRTMWATTRSRRSWETASRCVTGAPFPCAFILRAAAGSSAAARAPNRARAPAPAPPQVGHGVILHACTIEDDCVIGMALAPRYPPFPRMQAPE